MVALEDSKEGLIVNTCFLVSPEVLDEFVYLVVIKSQFHVLEYIAEVLAGKRATALLFEQLEGLSETLDAGLSKGLDEQVEYLFLAGAGLDAVPGELADELLEADLAILVVVDRGKQEVHLLLREVQDVQHVEGAYELLSGQLAVLVSIELLEGLQGGHPETFQLHAYLVED